MLSNYIKIAWRNLVRNWSFSLINVSGLAIGMAAAALIFLWVQQEYSYDQFHKNKGRIYEVWNKDVNNGKINCWNVTPQPMAHAIRKDYDEIDKVVRVNYGSPSLISFGEKRIKANTNVVDSGFLQVFSFPLLKGDKATCLNQGNSIVINNTVAAKLFDDQDPIGKVIKLDNEYLFTITGVLADLPLNTMFDFECLVSYKFMSDHGSENKYWGNNSTATYAMLKPNVSLSRVQEKLKTLRKRYDKDSPEMETFLYPFTRARLHGQFKNGVESGGRITVVHTFTLIAFLLLLIACINFMNLSTARSEKRAKEVGVRKVIGALRFSLIRQFMTESILISFISGCLAFALISYILPVFNDLVGKKLMLDFNDYKLLTAAVSFIVLTGILAGSYPALFLSSFEPVAVLKGTFRKVQALVTPRKVLVVGQFVFSILLIIATLVIRQQIKYGQSRQTGFDKDRLVFHMMEGDLEKNYDLIKNELLQSGLALSVTKTMSPITEGWSNSGGMQWEGKDPKDKTMIDRFCADDAVSKTFGFKVVAGRDIDLNTYKTDSTAALINEATVKLMGYTNPADAIGKIIKDNLDWHIVGVVKDFILRSPFQPINPTIIQGAKAWFQVIHVKYSNSRSMHETLAATELLFKKYNPEFPFNYSFADVEYEKKYSDEKRISKLSGLFAGLTIFISCLGLFGLVSYMAASRTKELGVRKVLGASVSNIVTLLSKDFLTLVAIAFVIATPLAYWLMNNWLREYPYRISITWWVFAIAGGAIMLIALGTVGFQALRAAVSNPVKSLRTE